MSTSNKLLRAVLINVAVASFCALLGAIYEHYSHGVISYFMIYAFAPSLVLGAFVPLVIKVSGKKYPHPTASWFWNAGIATLTVGSIFYGVIEIYGTTNRLATVYPAVGGAMLFIGAVTYFLLPGEQTKDKNGGDGN